MALTQEENQLLTGTDRGTPCGELMRRYWQPAGLSEELPEGGAPLPVRLLGEDLVLFRVPSPSPQPSIAVGGPEPPEPPGARGEGVPGPGEVGLIGLHCSHRGADLSYGRLEDGGLRCIYHGWLYDIHGRCLEQPGEPAFRWTDSGGRDSAESSVLGAQAQGGSFREKIRHKSYPCIEKNGLIFAYLGPGEPPLLPNYGFLEVPADHVYAVKLFSDCNYLQGNEGNVDLLHTSFLHYSNQDLHQSAWADGRQGEAGEPLLDSRGSAPFRERCEAELVDVGLRICKIRDMGEDHEYLRAATFIYPNMVAVPGGQTNWHVPIDDTHHWKYTIVFSSDGTLDPNDVSRRHTMDEHYHPVAHRENRYLQDRELMRGFSYCGIDPRYFQQQDLCATEGAGAIQDRTQEHLVANDAPLVVARKLLVGAIRDVQEGRDPPGVARDPAANSFANVVTTFGDLAEGVSWKEHCRDLVAEGRGWTGRPSVSRAGA